MNVRNGFTIVELLVVVTIMVILLALLAPAMDKAVYQAELAVCASQLDVISTGLIQYGLSNRKSYPDRPSRTANGANRPCDIYWGSNNPLSGKDDRKLLRTLFDLNKTLNDPLLKAVDIDGSEDTTTIVIPRALYYGFGYDKNGLSEKIMRKLGDRWTWTEAGDGSAPPVVNRMSVLASDWDFINENQSGDSWNQSSHPDADGLLEEFTIQDDIFLTPVPKKTTLAVWRGAKRGLIDTNYAYDDGSVRRFSGVAWDEAGSYDTRHRLVRLPHNDANNGATAKIRVPAQ